jgi:hypothetical protein
VILYIRIILLRLDAKAEYPEETEVAEECKKLSVACRCRCCIDVLVLHFSMYLQVNIGSYYQYEGTFTNLFEEMKRKCQEDS